MSENNVEFPALDSDNQDEVQNKAIVSALYKAIDQGQIKTMAEHIASDLEWWFHGPPQCHHMMRMLTGESFPEDFRFVPRSIEVIGDCVIAEGWEGAKVYWVHVWTLKEGLITQFREYFNTWLTVKDIRPHSCEISHANNTLWQSQPEDLFQRSLPGLVLGI